MEEPAPEIQQKKIDLLIDSYQHICRFCTEERFLRPILQPGPDPTNGKVFNEQRQIGMLLSTYMDFNLDLEIGLPKYICDDCIDALSRWHRFQVRCAATTDLLYKALDQMAKSIEVLPNEQINTHEHRVDSPPVVVVSEEIVYSVEIELEDERQLYESTDEQEEETTSSAHNLLPTMNVDSNSASITPLHFGPDKLSNGMDTPGQPKIKAPGRQCPVCGILVKAKLKHHLMRHADANGQPFKCDQCDKAYRFKRTLAMHVKHAHENLRFRCEVCSKQFCSKDVLRVHLKLHTNSEQQYRCETCGRCFKQLMYLRKHSSVHNMVPQFQCDHCGKTFRIKQQLKQHIRVHTGEKPYECPLCSKRFRSLNNLRQHNRIHAKEKPYRCAHCSAAFSNRQSLTRHENSSKCSRRLLAASKGTGKK